MSEENSKTLVAPIELKGGKVGSISHVANQLQGGANRANKLLPEETEVQLVPVLARKKSIHPHDLKKLLNETISMRGNNQKIIVIKCCGLLPKALRL